MKGPRPTRAGARGVAYALLAVLLIAGAIPASGIRWRGNAEFHTLLEVIATQLALMTGAMALVRYYTKKSTMFLLLGSGFIGAALLDGYHAVITSSFLAGRTNSALSALVPWSGAISRIFLSLLLCVSVLAFRKEKKNEVGRTTEFIVYLLVGAWTLVAFLFFTLVRLPAPSYPQLFIHRPLEFIPA